MEIKNVSKALIKQYPKKEEVTKKQIKNSFLSTWKKMGITYAFVYNYLAGKAYGTFQNYLDIVDDSVEASLDGGYAEPHSEFFILGKEINLSGNIAYAIRIIEIISYYLWRISFAVMVYFLVKSILEGIFLKKKPHISKIEKVIIIVGIISFLISL